MLRVTMLLPRGRYFFEVPVLPAHAFTGCRDFAVAADFPGYPFCLHVLYDHAEELFEPLVFRVGEKFNRRPLFLNPALVDKEHPIRHFPGKAHFMGDHNHCHAFLSEPFHNLEYFADQFRVKR